jgi:hypothetical protein
VIYLTQTRLMVESEKTVHDRATQGEGVLKRVCSQLVADPPRYALWRDWHSRRMLTVAERRRRDRQIVALRAVHLEQIHRAALVRYLRKNRITGAARDQTLNEFHGLMDPVRATLAEHRTYVMSASSQLCAYDLLKMVEDKHGLALLQDYQGTYGQFFGMFCDQSRAIRNGARYVLSGLIPDAKAEAEALRRRILAGDLVPPTPVAVKSGATLSGRFSRATRA